MFEFLIGLDIAGFTGVLSAVAQSQIAQMGFFFTLAAWVHSGRVKKEIALHFASLTQAINNVANSLERELAQQSKTLANHGKRLETLENVTLKEKPNQGEANA